MLVPFDRIEDAGDRYRAELRGVNASIYVLLPKDGVRIVEKDGRVYAEVDEDELHRNPWLRLVQALANRKFVVPVVRDSRAELVYPVAVLSESHSGAGDREMKFLGYHIVVEGGRVVDIRDAGLYAKYIPAGINELLSPPVQLKTLVELTPEEREVLGSRTPPQFIRLLDAKNWRDLAAMAIAAALRRDPLSLVDEVDPDTLSKYLEESIVRQAMLETTPEMIMLLIEQYMAHGRDAQKLAILLSRYWEEKTEDRQVEKIRREEEERREREQEDEARRRRTREVVEMHKDLIREVFGLTVPIVLSVPLVGASIRVLKRVEAVDEGSEEVREVRESQ